MKKCKSMYIGKNVEDVLNNHLVVDKWTTEHKANSENSEYDLVEHMMVQLL